MKKYEMIGEFIETMNEMVGMIGDFTGELEKLAGDDDDAAVAYLLASAATIIDYVCETYHMDRTETRKMIYEISGDAEKEAEKTKEMPWFS